MTHTLHLPETVELDDLLALVQNWFPEASRKGKSIHITDGVTFAWDKKAHTAAIEVPRERDTEPADELSDGYGVNTAFAEGVPVGVERDIVELALGIVRRLGGHLETDSGHSLQPHQFMLPDLQVVAAHALSAEQLLEIVREIVKESEIENGVATETGLPYSIILPVMQDADLRVIAEPLEYDIPAISHVDWVKKGACSYQVMYEPHDQDSAVSENPDKAQIRAWREAYLGCSAIAKAVHNVTGGFILDLDGFLVNADELF